MLLNARRIDHLDLILLAIEDITERIQYQSALRASEERLRKVLETEAVGVIFFDQAGNLIDCNESFLHMTGYAREDIAAGSMTWRSLTPPEWVAVSEEQLARLKELGRIGPYEKQYLVKDGSKSWMLFAGRDLGDGTIVEICLDISNRKKAEEQRELLARELSHRVKNVLAVVQSLAMMTAESARDVAEYRSAFLGRLRALSRAHNLLIDSPSQSAELRNLVETTLAPYCRDRVDAVEVEGAPVVIAGERCVGIVLILHELATNAAKHGALSTADGRLSVSWRLANEGDQQQVSLTWRESNGPPVRRPSSQGFGTKLIERASVAQLHGKAELHYEPSGLICTIEFPIP